MNKILAIEEKLEAIEKCLDDAEEYVARNANVEGSPWFHWDDWKGKSGHPLWVKNFMIPTTKKGRAKKEKAMERISRANRDKSLGRRRRPKNHP